jgi:hypothetical protein
MKNVPIFSTLPGKIRIEFLVGYTYKSVLSDCALYKMRKLKDAMHLREKMNFYLPFSHM